MQSKIFTIIVTIIYCFNLQAIEKDPNLVALDVTNTCDTEDEIINASVVLDYFKNEIWWNIGGQRSLFHNDFEILHTSLITSIAGDPAFFEAILKNSDGIFRSPNFLNGWSLVAIGNSREYYHLNFHQIICIGPRVVTTSEFSGLIVRRDKKGQVTHAVKYGSPVTHIMELKKDKLGFSKIHRFIAVLQDNNLANKARVRLNKLSNPAPTEICNGNNLKNEKLGLKNQDKPIGLFDINPLNKTPNPYKYDPEIDEQPLITCIDQTMTQTPSDIYNEFAASLKQAGYNPDGTQIINNQ